MNGIQGLPVLPCAGIPVRPDPPTVLEYTAAEYWVLYCYRKAFLESRPLPRIVTSQLERLYTTYNSSDDVMDLVLTVLQLNFRNVLLPRLVSLFKRLLNAGAADSELRALLRQMDAGGNLKPDMLGICAAGAIEFDAVEVGTVKTAQSTFSELQSKLGILQSIIVPQLRLELPILSVRRAMSVPTQITVAGSTWRLKPSERILPLPVKVTTTGQVDYADWICFHPTMTWRSSSSPVPALGWRGGEDGLVLYHIHRLPMKSLELPSRVKSEVQSAIRQWQWQQRLTLTLLPTFPTTVRQDQSAFSPEAKAFIGYMGLAGLLVMTMAVAWELGVFAGAGALAQQGLAALAATPEVMAPTIAATKELTDQFWNQLAPVGSPF